MMYLIPPRHSGKAAQQKTTMQSNKLTALVAAALTVIVASPSLNALTIYESDDSDLLQSVDFTGRLQYDLSYFDSDQAGSETKDAWRRARAGFKAKAFKNLTIHVEADLDLGNHDPVYNQLTDAYLGWKTSNGMSIKVGKQSAAFTLDGQTSSKRLIAIERSPLNNNIWFTREYFSGITVSGKQDKWSYNYGIFSNDAGAEFSEVGDEKYFVLLSVAYDLSEEMGVDNASVAVDFVHNRETANSGTKSLENVLSVSGQYDKGAFHIWGDLAYAKAFNGAKLFGIQVMPFYDINDTFQVVGRLTWVDGSKHNTLGLSRYERDLVGGKGDDLKEIFIGLNTYFKGHSLKWQNGLQYTEMKDGANDGGEYAGIGFTSAIRFYW